MRDLILIATFLASGTLACSSEPVEVLSPGRDAGVGGQGMSSGTGGASSLGAGGETVTSNPCLDGPPVQFASSAEELFASSQVPRFELFLPDAQWEELKSNAQEEEYHPAQLCFAGEQVGEVGLRFKGSYGSLYGCFNDAAEQICPKLSMKVKFNKYEEDLRFFGLKRLNFHANQHDDSRIRERLVYDLFREMGVKAPRASWAELIVNGELLGLFGMVEQVDGRFTADRFGDYQDGNLYKELWPGREGHEEIIAALKTNEDEAEVASFEELSMDLRESKDEAAFRERLAQSMDLDHISRFLAVEDAVASYDGITYFWTDGVDSQNHNFYLYESEPEHFTLIPWDVEASFWLNPDHAAPHWTLAVEDCTETYPYWDGQARAPACDPILRALHSDLSAWRNASQELLEGAYSEEVMGSAIDAHSAFIREAVERDPTPEKYTSFEEALENLKTEVASLRKRLQSLVVASEE